jgi:hypothetical protein
MHEIEKGQYIRFDYLNPENHRVGKVIDVYTSQAGHSKTVTIQYTMHGSLNGRIVNYRIDGMTNIEIINEMEYLLLAY